MDMHSRETKVRPSQAFGFVVALPVVLLDIILLPCDFLNAIHWKFCISQCDQSAANPTASIYVKRNVRSPQRLTAGDKNAEHPSVCLSLGCRFTSAFILMTEFASHRIMIMKISSFGKFSIFTPYSTYPTKLVH
jgi:hypothetical protein